MWDLSLPGYHYLGPGNKLNKGKPTNFNDFVAYIHDLGYGAIIEQGGNPYFLWSDADAAAYNKFTTEDYGGALAKAFFGIKKVAYHTGLIDKFEFKDTMMSRKRRPIPRDETPEKRLRGSDERALAVRPDNEMVDYANYMDEETSFNDFHQLLDNHPANESSLSNMSSNAQPGPRDPDPGVETAAAPGAGGPNSVSKETPIAIAQPSYGLQETHTAILPWTGWLSAAGLTKTTPAQLKIRMNTPYDMLDVTTIATPGDGTRMQTKGFYAVAQDPINRYSNSVNANFPEALSAGASIATERPAWRDYWAQIYDFYTVLGCEYEIIMYNPVQQTTADIALLPQFNAASVMTAVGLGALVGPSKFNTDCVCAVQVDTYSDTATSTGNVMPLTNYSEVRAFKNIKWYPIPGGQKAVIKGVYRPGDGKRNIVNDGDVKTWTATSVSTLPNLKEMLTLNFWCDPFFNGRYPDTYDADSLETTGASSYGAVNIEINLKYIVQFKDLKQQARYPNKITTDQDLIQTLNETSTATGSALQRWT
uniref:Capsid protein n=1 Tax=Parvoviridae sp. TaxID=1940570 RepID=A0A7D3V1E8_9VIRU|nr:MAG: capsid protein [Parvoviridae sp.]